ncbi:MAG TPA: polyprenyl synthetase family protein [Thermoanaerobaculia bacterium]|nr:polyprenyl synthetase family protein [Thermoanaerobaculia bacterium]
MPFESSAAAARNAPGAFDRFAARERPRLEEVLSRSLPERSAVAPALFDAASAAVLSRGKRLRPLVALAAGELFKAPRPATTAVAVAVEYLHAASLVLDDLPSMDDALRRRGQPALHVTHGVATAELVAVALITRAFETVAAGPAMSAGVRARVVGELAAAVGAEGCCAGQAADLAANPSVLSLEDLEAIHARKTGALFVAAVRGGALAGGARERSLSALTLFARNVGLAFQITDDLLDLEGDAEAMGKDTGRDAHRANFAALLGPTSSRQLVEELLEAGVSALAPFGGKGMVLADLARVVRDRRS